MVANNNNIDYTLYGIYYKNISNLVYIGITKQKLSRRLSQHLRDYRRNKRKFNFLNKYKNYIGITPITCNIKTLEDANNFEKEKIYELKNSGIKLLNATEGGDGTAGFTAWNKGVQCSYIEKLKNNSPNKKMVYSYDLNGNFLSEFNSIKEASKITTASRQAIKFICEGKRKSSKNLIFSYKKLDKIESIKYDDSLRLNKVREGLISKMKKVSIISDGVEYIFKNAHEASAYFNMNIKTMFIYCSTNKETNKYKYKYI